MEALWFSSSDSGEDTDVLEYTSDGSQRSDEDMASARASIEDMDDGDAGDGVVSNPPEETLTAAAYQGGVGDANIGAEDGENSDSSLEYDCYNEQVGLLSTSTADRHVVTSYETIGYFDTEAIAEQKLHQLNQFVYSYKTRYESTFRTGKEFQCRSHKDCQHRIKLITHRVGTVGNKFQLLEKGVHSGTVVNLKVHGISPVIKPEVDALLGLGMAAGRVRNMMLFKYLTNPAMLLLIPETKQLENRKAYLTRKAGDGWEISKFITLRNWTSTKFCQTRVDFYRACESDMAAMNDLIVLDDFEHLVNVDGISVASLGVIVTSRALFRNVERAASEQGNNLVLSTDGTYRIHFGGWTLVDCGGISGARSGTGYVQRFRPWLYMFVRTESIFAYERMFRALVTYAKLFFDVVVKVFSASIDHADAIASALVSVWPHVEILTCWEHLLRNARKQTQLENTKGFIKDVALLHLRQLHESRSLKQFRALSKRVVSAWIKAGEVKLAEWLSSVYLTRRWERWSVNSSSVPGFLPTQQPIESHHRVIKVIVTDYKKAPTIMVLNSVLPRVLLYDATNLSSEPHRHYAEGSLPVSSVLKAKEELLLQPNYCIARSSTRIRIFFNSQKTMVQPVQERNLAAASVTEERTERFKNSLLGKLGPPEPIQDAAVSFLSLQQVTVDRRELARMNSIIPRSKWRATDIQSVRDTFRCTCKGFMHTGWVCSHVIASLDLLDKVKIGLALQKVPMRGLPGRPRSVGGGLQRDTNPYDVDRLVELFTKSPGRPLKWPVVQEFEVEDDGKTYKEHRIGQVAGCRLCTTEGVYVWSVTFIHGDSLEYQAEELAHAVRRAHSLRTE